MKLRYLTFAFFEPSNIMCSNRWANPVRPARSFFEPTWYHEFTWTIGSLRSTCRITWSPLGNVYFSNASLGTSGEGALAWARRRLPRGARTSVRNSARKRIKQRSKDYTQSAAAAFHAEVNGGVTEFEL